MISSPSNGAVKQIRALRARKAREETGLFLVEGIRIVTEAAELGADIESLMVAPDLLTSDHARGVVQRLEARGVPVLQVSPRVFGTISVKEHPQGIAATVRQRWERLEDVTPGDELCWIALDAVADPGNLGTILRTSDAAGGAGVILLGHTTDPYDPAALRASMGAVFAQRLVRAEAADLQAWKRRHRVFAVGTSDAATTGYREAPYRRPLLLVMGSERQGLSTGVASLCDVIVSIPMRGQSDSLNLAVATGIMLYTILDRRDAAE